MKRKIGLFELEIWWMAGFLIVAIVGVLIAYILPVFKHSDVSKEKEKNVIFSVLYSFPTS